MRAVRIEAPNDLRVVEVRDPEPSADEVVIDVAYAGICGSDVEVLAGTRPSAYVRYPVVPGHEWSGTVRSVGAGVDPALVGRKVVAEGFHSCGACDACRAGDSTLCTAGYDETGFTRPGAWAEQLVTGADLLHPLGADADLRSAAGLEPAACSAAAVLQADARPGDRVAVVGGGTIGLLAVQLLLPAIDREILLVEPDARRAALARSWGADAIHPRDADLCGATFDVAIEAAGAPGTADLAVGLVRRGGRVVLAGIPGGPDTLRVDEIVTKRLDIATVFGAPREAWTAAVVAFGAGTLDPGLLVTHELDLGDASAALDLVRSRAPRTGKVLLRP